MRTATPACPPLSLLLCYCSPNENGHVDHAGGLLHIEDVLPFFPDFVAIDNFKGAITDSLARYNTQIEELKAEMDEATAIAGGL